MNRLSVSHLLIVAIVASIITAFPVFAQTPITASVLVARIAGNLNTKSAKIGDPVTAKTVKALKSRDGTDIPRGSKLLGKVVAIRSKQDCGGNSGLAIRFEQVEVKGGAVLPIVGLIVAIGPAPDTPGGIGYDSVLGRGGAGSTPGTDPRNGAPSSQKDGADLPPGSTLEGVSLDLHLTADGATMLLGVKRDIKLDPDAMIKVELD
jgi:hypothetical protein